MGREVLAVLLAFDPPAGVLEEVGPGDGAREEGKAAPGAVEERNVFRRMLAKARGAPARGGRGLRFVFSITADACGKLCGQWALTCKSFTVYPLTPC